MNDCVTRSSWEAVPFRGQASIYAGMHRQKGVLGEGVKQQELGFCRAARVELEARNLAREKSRSRARWGA